MSSKIDPLRIIYRRWPLPDRFVSRIIPKNLTEFTRGTGLPKIFKESSEGRVLLRVKTSQLDFSGDNSSPRCQRYVATRFKDSCTDLSALSGSLLVE